MVDIRAVAILTYLTILPTSGAPGSALARAGREPGEPNLTISVITADGEHSLYTGISLCAHVYRLYSIRSDAKVVYA